MSFALRRRKREVGPQWEAELPSASAFPSVCVRAPAAALPPTPRASLGTRLRRLRVKGTPTLSSGEDGLGGLADLALEMGRGEDAGVGAPAQDPALDFGEAAE